MKIKFHELLRKIRIDMGLTQEQMAEKLHTSPQNIYHYETMKRNITFDQGMEILSILGQDILIKNNEIKNEFMLRKMYVDKNNGIIKEGMYLKHEDGEIKEVFKADDGDLGLDATNKKYIGNVEGFLMHLYPLSEYDLREWEIVKK